MLKIVIVEDDPQLASMLRHLIDLDPDHKVTGIAHDGDAAVQAVDADKPDLALVDLQLANGTSGYSVAAKLKERGVLCLFITGNVPSFPLPDLAIGCLSKPFRQSELECALAQAEEILRGRCDAPPARKLPEQLQIYALDGSAGAAATSGTTVSECPTCSAKDEALDLGRIRVVEAPPKAFIDGQELRLGITQVRLLGALVRTGMASRDQLTQIGVGPNAGLRTLDVQLNRLRHGLRPFGLHVRAIPKWGFELVKHERRASALDILQASMQDAVPLVA